MKILSKYLGGSKSYHLDTPASDNDERFVFVCDKISEVIGLDRLGHHSEQDAEKKVDVFGWELRHFLNMLRRGNTMCLEMLFNNTWIEVTPEFQDIQAHRTSLIGSHQLYKCLRGYCQSERGLVNGERVGQLGGARRAHIEKYGYSYKNAVQFLRLCRAGEIFFQTGTFPVNIRPHDVNDTIMTVKTCPHCYNLPIITKLMDEYEAKLVESYKNIKVVYEFDDSVANNLCLQVYYPLLTLHYNQQNRFQKDCI